MGLRDSPQAAGGLGAYSAPRSQRVFNVKICILMHFQVLKGVNEEKIIFFFLFENAGVVSSKTCEHEKRLKYIYKCVCHTQDACELEDLGRRHLAMIKVFVVCSLYLINSINDHLDTTCWACRN